MAATSRRRRIAVVDEDRCIGCTLCIKACPVDAIVGAHAFMHTVVEHECIGCELCVKPCPTDCIEMVTGQTPFAARARREQARRARERRRRRTLRLAARAQAYSDAMHARREQLKAAIQRKAASREVG